jgi:hypothetical protein
MVTVYKVSEPASVTLAAMSRIVNEGGSCEPNPLSCTSAVSFC